MRTHSCDVTRRVTFGLKHNEDYDVWCKVCAVCLVDYKVKEILAVSGGPWGGAKVDQAFEHLVARVLGANVVNTFRKKHPDQWLDFIGRFERACLAKALARRSAGLCPAGQYLKRDDST